MMQYRTYMSSAHVTLTTDVQGRNWGSGHRDWTYQSQDSRLRGWQAWGKDSAVAQMHVIINLSQAVSDFPI